MPKPSLYVAWPETAAVSVRIQYGLRILRLSSIKCSTQCPRLIPQCNFRNSYILKFREIRQSLRWNCTRNIAFNISKLLAIIAKSVKISLKKIARDRGQRWRECFIISGGWTTIWNRLASHKEDVPETQKQFYRVVEFIYPPADV